LTILEGTLFMQSIIKKSLVILLILLPIRALAINVGDYFQQGITVVNQSGQGVLITDPASSTLQNYPLSNGYYLDGKYNSDQFTDPAGQTFIHVVTINSAVDYGVICVVQSNLFISQNSISLKKPNSTNESRCQTSTYMKSGSTGTIYGFKIFVN
jgi:hypothetical protein